MIINFNKNFIFLDMPKTSSMTMNVILSQYSDDKDIITCIDYLSEQKMFRLFKKKPQNYNYDYFKILNLIYSSQYLIHNFKNYLKKFDIIRKVFNPKIEFDKKYYKGIHFKYYEKFYYGQHCELVKHKLGKRFDTMKKICFVRNPYSQLFGLYKMNTKMRINFDDYLYYKVIKKKTFETKRKLIEIDNKIVIDHIIRYENALEDLSKLENIFNIDIVKYYKDLRLNNLDQLRSSLDYREFYSKKSQQLVKQHAGFFLDNFDYKF